MNKWFPTPPLRVVDLPADSRHRGGFRGLAPEMIVLHHTAGTDSRAWLTTNPRSNVSVHRLIAKDGTIYKIVEDEGLAHHVGNATMYPIRYGTAINANRLALGIELENKGDGRDNYPWVQVLAAAEQCAEWWGKYGYLPILAHGWIDGPKIDPANFNWELFMGMLMEEYRQNTINPDR